MHGDLLAYAMAHLFTITSNTPFVQSNILICENGSASHYSRLWAIDIIDRTWGPGDRRLPRPFTNGASYDGWVPSCSTAECLKTSLKKHHMYVLPTSSRLAGSCYRSVVLHTGPNHMASALCHNGQILSGKVPYHDYTCEM